MFETIYFCLVYSKFGFMGLECYDVATIIYNGSVSIGNELEGNLSILHIEESLQSAINCRCRKIVFSFYL